MSIHNRLEKIECSQQVREKWPEADGWVGHITTPRRVSKALLIDTVERISEDPSGDEASEMSSDLVM